MNAELKFTDIVKNFILNKARRVLLKIINAMDEAPDLSVPYVYVPLHYTPENSDLHFGPEYDHHEAFIVHLAKYMPSDCQLYVKEHTSMPGRRPLYFYKNLEKLYNVKVLSPKVDTFALIKNAKATVTVTGTPGWEAFLLGRPAVVFGNVFFNNLPGILKTEMKDGFHKVFVDYIENFKPDPDVIRNAFRAYYASTFKAAKVDVGYTSSKNQALEHAEAFVRDVKRVIYNRHDEMKGHFPLDLIEEDLSMEKNMQNRASV